MYNFLSIGLLRLAQEAHVNRDLMSQVIYGERRYAFLKDWLVGATVGIDNKLTKQKEQSVHSEEISGLVLYNKEALKKFLKIENPEIKTVKRKRIAVGPAYKDGIEAGENYSINPPLKHKEVKELK
jgi:hypothetical protein